MKKLILSFFLIILCILLTTISGWTSGSGKKSFESKEYLKFSHSKHITVQGIECETCHEKAKESSSPKDHLMPTHEVCSPCHGNEVDSKCEFCHIGDPAGIPQEAFERELIFNHKFHIADQKILCTKCHSNIVNDSDNKINSFPPMNSCTGCHNNTTAANQCELCHTNTSTLWPPSHSIVSFKKEHKRFLQTAKYGEECQSCHNEAFCTQCHDGTNLTELTPKVKSGMVSPRSVGNDKSHIRAGETVHDANFRFTHAIEAKSRLTDCQSCHNNKTFCNDCHNYGSADLGSIRPLSHKSPGFAARPNPTHAKLARRDIQRCAVCHDAESAEPACIQCHSDPDGRKGTDAKTHDKNYMNDTKGDWHSDVSSKCYVCHTDMNARPNGIKGKNFCGYCH